MWLKIDDGFHCHPKVLAAGNAAVGLFVRCGSWAAQQTSEGVVPKAIAKMYGTPRQIRALIDAGLWHEPGHGCGSCDEVEANSYLIHQFLERNPSRNEVDSARKAKSERQQRWREGKKNAQAKQGETPDVDADVDASHLGGGDAAPDPTRPDPTPVPPTEVQQASSREAVADRRPGEQGPSIPAASAPLVEALTNAGVVVGWNLGTAEWLVLEALIKRVGVPALIDHAIAAANAAKTPPRSARYLLAAWRDLPTITPAAPGQPRLRAVPQSPTTSYLADMAAIADELSQTGGA